MIELIAIAMALVIGVIKGVQWQRGRVPRPVKHDIKKVEWPDNWPDI